MNKFFLKKIKIIKVEKYLKKNQYINLCNIIKSENAISVIAKLNLNILIKYLKICSKSKNIGLFLCTLENKIIGYCLFVRKPKYLFKDFRSLNFDLIFFLIKKLNFVVLLNIFISYFRLDILFLSSENKNIIANNLNLNMISIQKNFQSKGIGGFFLKKVMTSFYKKRLLTLETFDKRAVNFYKNKLKFEELGKKIRFFKIYTIFKKNFN